jgi:hypothetical protein
MRPIDVYLEIGRKRVFSAALGWPGWCRSGRDEASALRALVEYGPRYGAAIGKAVDGFAPAKDAKDLNLVERLEGDATTDFGAPHVPSKLDSEPLDDRELDRLSKLLQASWQKFDSAAQAASSTTLRTGPRGGGRDVPKMRAHVLESDASYVAQLGGRFRPSGRGPATDMKGVRQAFLDTLAARVRGELPTVGARGGLRWSPRYAIRRSAWHALDHAWEIEDRST